MAIICWGSLAKSADDTQKIEQSIQDYVEGHNENPNAHQIEGSSLYMHRINEILDHEIGSVEFKFLPKNKRYAMSMFESLDGWTTHGSCVAGIFGARIQNNNGATPYKGWITASPYTGLPALQFTKNPFFQTTVRITGTTNQKFYIGTSAQIQEVEHDGFGFYIEDLTLYAYWKGAGGVHTVEITGIAINDFVCYRAEMDSTNGKINYYVNGDLKYTAETDMPVSDSPVYFQYYVEGTNSNTVYIYPIDFIFQQDT